MGFIFIEIGNRGGHPQRSKWYHNFGYGNLRGYGLADKKAAIEQQIAEAQRAERAGAVAKVRALMAEHGLTLADLSAKSAGPKRSGAKVPPKYRDAATGETWTGRGLQPKWIQAAIAAGKKLEDFAI